MNQPPFPYEVLPPSLQQVMYDVYKKTKAPPAMIFTALMASLATAGQDKHRVKRKEGLTSNISIYTICLAVSGERKTTVENIIFKPLHDIQVRLEAEHAEAMQAYKVARQKWELKGKTLEKMYLKTLQKGNEDSAASKALAEHSMDEPKEPACAKLFYTDTTPEAWLAGLKQHSRSSTLLDDEGGRSLNGPLMRSTGQLCSLWDGKTIDIQRKQAGSFSVDSPRVSISIQVQPEVFYNYFNKKGDEARTSGLTGRFLISHPATHIGLRFEDNTSHDPCAALEIFHERLIKLYSQSEDITLTMSPDAQVLWTDNFNAIEAYMAPGGYLSGLQDFGSKVPENTARLAALIHLSFDDSTQISRSTLLSAINVMAWYCHEAVRIFSSTGEQNQFMKDIAALEAFLNRIHSTGKTDVKTQEILQNGPARLRRRSALDPILNHLFINGRCMLYSDGKTQYVRLLQPRATSVHATRMLLVSNSQALQSFSFSNPF